MPFNNNNSGNKFGRRENLQPMRKASEMEIASPFTNPYTFIPFPDVKDAQEQFAPSLLTADEFNTDKRYTGVLELKVKTLSPLMTLRPENKTSEELQSYKALTIGNDVIVPATSIRGSLRNLMTVLTGSALGYLDTNMWLCQGRDVALGKTQSNPKGHPILALVEKPGDSTHSGFIRLGETKLITDEAIDTKPLENDWMVKLSGTPVNSKGVKKKGLFRPDSNSNAVIEISSNLWLDYENRNRFGFRPKLREGDLVWIEPINVESSSVSSEKEIASLQWARWGKRGTNLNEALPSYIRPCAAQKNGKVDIVTDLFGMIPMEDGTGKSFASRIRCHNLIFKNEAIQLKKVTLAVLATPHPGCLAFYRKGTAENISQESALKGYKVYRNTKETGSNAPWHYAVQGVYKEKGALKEATGALTKEVELLAEKLTGSLKISVRALSKKELAALLMACSVDWKLGGGKPLGLGHCQVTSVNFINEDGDNTKLLERDTEGMLLPNEFAELVKQYDKRVALYKKSQEPVEKLRYPRAVGENNNDIRREGLQWFSRHAAPKKTLHGLQPLYMNKGTTYAGQVLPELSLTADDFLYGYDLVPIGKTIDKRTLYEAFEIFDEKKTYVESHRGKNTAQNAATRQDYRNKRYDR